MAGGCTAADCAAADCTVVAVSVLRRVVVGGMNAMPLQLGTGSVGALASWAVPVEAVVDLAGPAEG